MSAWAESRSRRAPSAEDEPEALEELRSPGPPLGALALGFFLGALVSRLRSQRGRG